MLSRNHRLHRPADFTEVVRRGRRSSRPLLTIHCLLAPELLAPELLGPEPASTPARAGLVVSKAVGDAVARHLVSRRLRHLLRERITSLPGGARIVVRAAPASGVATSAALGLDLDAALASVLRVAVLRRGRLS